MKEIREEADVVAALATAARAVWLRSDGPGREAQTTK